MWNIWKVSLFELRKNFPRYSKFAYCTYKAMCLKCFCEWSVDELWLTSLCLAPATVVARGIMFGGCTSVCPSVLWTQYLRNALREILQIWLQTFTWIQRWTDTGTKVNFTVITRHLSVHYLKQLLCNRSEGCDHISWAWLAGRGTQPSGGNSCNGRWFVS